ncbi:MAG: DUF1501 domain-containing protein [Phycisphaerales bacterium]|nr:DUF1501 domain-containing protein [Phycisphaerales bacterium]MCB9854754.1 DUF1501 domain-containing protein [Phycisphaerales bacterium]MCB9863774.1 DUF1501 domain-containing protein [Phycisphaerales bacterium]
MYNYDKNACRDYNTVERRMRRAALNGDSFWGGMTRRQFMTRSAAATGAAAFASSLPMWFPECTFAAGGGCADHTFIFIHLFGGPDGLAMVCPIGDYAYINPIDGIRRPGSLLGVPLPGTGTPEDLIDLNDGYWALSGGLADLLDIWNDGALAIATGCTLPGQSYSHFTAERWVGQATPNPGVGLGGSMMARHLETATPYGGPIRGMSVASNLHDHLLGGVPYQAIPIANAENFGIQGISQSIQTAWLNAMVEMYGNQNKLAAWEDLSIVTRDAITLLNSVTFPPSPEYDTSYLGDGLRRVAALLKAGIGLETVTLRTGGWDTHNNQGSNNSQTGQMWLLMESLARNLKAFWQDMTTNGSNRCWTIYMTGEFGRDAEPPMTSGGNPVTPETAGTDHGYATNVYMMGTNICGGQVINAGLWPGVDTLHNPGSTVCGGTNDVCLGTDPRIFLAEIFDRLMGNQANLSYLFPDYQIPAPSEYMGVVC